MPCELVLVDTRLGEQHTPEFSAINPNGKTPALVDDDAVIFDSNAILLYVAEKRVCFCLRTPRRRGLPCTRG